jgi:sugar O-acyltransferase (sialic acid O-acetyltransferase NeuD family)
MSDDRGPRQRILLAGAGGFAEEVMEVAHACGFEVAAWIEGRDPQRSRQAHEPPIVWVDEQAAFEPGLGVAPAIGSVRRSALMDRLVSEGRRLVTLVHPSAVVAPSTVIEDGCVLARAVVIGPYARIGAGTILTNGVLIGHHTVIGRHSFLGQGANVAGGVVTGPEVLIGLGAVVREHLTIGQGAVVGAGAVVVEDVPAGTTVIGLPARPIERHGDVF